MLLDGVFVLFDLTSRWRDISWPLGMGELYAKMHEKMYDINEIMWAVYRERLNQIYAKPNIKKLEFL